MCRLGDDDRREGFSPEREKYAGDRLSETPSQPGRLLAPQRDSVLAGFCSEMGRGVNRRDYALKSFDFSLKMLEP